jgi:hypothetical protein
VLICRDFKGFRERVSGEKWFSGSNACAFSVHGTFEGKADLGDGSMSEQTIPVEPRMTSRYQRLFGIRIRALVLALFAYVGSGIGVSAVRTFEIFTGSEGESLPVLEATEVRRKTFHETHLHHRRYSERQRRKQLYRPKPLWFRLIAQPETFTSPLDTSPPSLRAPPLPA